MSSSRTIRVFPADSLAQAAADEHERLRGLLEEANVFFRHALLQTAPGKPALEYLQKRGLTLATIGALSTIPLVIGVVRGNRSRHHSEATATQIE